MAGCANRKAAMAIGIAATFFAACSCQTKTTTSKNSKPDLNLMPETAAAEFVVSEERAKLDLAELALSPHPFGSERQKVIQAWLKSRAQEEGAKVVLEEFSADIPNPAASDPSAPAPLTLKRSGANVYAIAGLNSAPECVVLIGSHYDTKILDSTNYLGANDSGSSSLALLQLLAGLKKIAAAKNFIAPRCDIVMVWFDGEEAALPDWNDGLTSHPAKIQDNTYGSRYAVSRYTDCLFDSKGDSSVSSGKNSASISTKCMPSSLSGLAGKPVAALVLLDMIGSPDVVLVRELNSTQVLVDLAVGLAEKLDMTSLFEESPRGVEDDHVPFVKAGIPALDLIDFYHLDYWHKAGDDPVKISVKSIEKVAKVALGVALTAAYEPESVRN